jgi:hypothetical protein
MSQAFVIDPISGKLVQPKLADDVTPRFTVVNNQELVRTGEGPTTWTGLADTLSYFAQPDAPPPFVLVNNISNFTSSPRWADWDTGGVDWTALSTYCTIVDGTNLREYISVGDMVLQSNFEEIKALGATQAYSSHLFTKTVPMYLTPEKNALFLFAHKKIVTFVPVVQDMSLEYAYQTLSHGDVNAGTGDVKDMYYSLGSSIQVYKQDIGKGSLPVILKAFLTVQNTGILSTVSENADSGYNMTCKVNYMEYPIRNAFRVNDTSFNYYSPVRGVKQAVRSLMSMLLALGGNTQRIPYNFQLNSPYNEQKSLTLARSICNSTAEPDMLVYESFCSCLGRKGVEAKLQEVLGNKNVYISCLSKKCRNNDGYTFPYQPATPCTKESICIDPVNAKNVVDAIENYTNICQMSAPLPVGPAPSGENTGGGTGGSSGSSSGGSSSSGTTGGTTAGTTGGTTGGIIPPAPPSLFPGIPGIPPPAPAANGGPNVGVIAGSVVGVLIVIIVIIVVVVVLVRRKTRTTDETAETLVEVVAAGSESDV